jgi:hypothetical protein
MVVRGGLAMTTIRTLFPILFGVVLQGCAGTYQVVQIPQYEADLYPLSQAKAGITIAIDEIKSTQRAERYFGADLIKEGILPVNVVVSNYGKQRVVVKPSDILLYRGKEIIDPLPIEMVMATAKRQHAFLRSQTEEEVNKFFENTTFKETVLLPNEGHRGVIFFALPAPKRTMDRFFTAFSVYREGGPRVRVGLTNLDTGERLLFGPFSLTLPQNAGLFSYTSY